MSGQAYDARDELAKVATAPRERGEVQQGLEHYRDLLERLETAVGRVFETFAPVISIPPQPGADRAELARVAETQIGAQLHEANDRLERLIGAIHGACDGCRL